MLLLDTLTVAKDTFNTISPLVPESSNVIDSIVLSKQALEAIKEISINDASATDWIQAITAVVGGIVAFGALIYAHKSYKTTVRQQQDQINDQQNQINKLSDIAINLYEQRKEARERHLSEIRPNLHFCDPSYNINNINLLITNTGSTATNVWLEVPDDVGIVKNPNSSDKEEVKRLICYFKEGDTILYSHKSYNIICEVCRLNLENTDANGIKDFSFNIHYIDKDGNKYYQTVTGNEEEHKRGIALITPPKLS
jgi:hypothetical protein